MIHKSPSRRNEIVGPFIETTIRLGALALLLYWTLVFVSPFVSIFIWSIILTVALYPVFEWMALRLGGRRRLAAFLITVLTLLIVIGPATWLALGLIESVRVVSERFDASALAIPSPPMTVKDWPLIGDPIYQFWDLASTNFAAALAKILPQLKPLGSSLLRVGADTGVSIIKFLASIVIAGFLFSPAPAFADAVKQFSRRLRPDARRRVRGSSRSYDSCGVAWCYWYFSSAGPACRCRPDGRRHSSG